MKIADKLKQSTSKQIADIIFAKWIDDACSEKTRRVCQYDAHDCYECIYKWLESDNE